MGQEPRPVSVGPWKLGSRARPLFEGDRKSQLLSEALTALPRGSLPGQFLFTMLQGLLLSGSGNERCPLNRCQAPRPTQEQSVSFLPPLLSPSLAPLDPHPEARAIRNHCWSPRTGCSEHIAEYLLEKNDLEAGCGSAPCGGSTRIALPQRRLAALGQAGRTQPAARCPACPD